MKIKPKNTPVLELHKKVLKCHGCSSFMWKFCVELVLSEFGECGYVKDDDLDKS